MAKQTHEQLGVQAGDKIILKGKVAFARLDKLVEGQALDRENERRSKIGMLATKAFRSVSIEEPEMVQGEGTPLAQYYGQNIYQSKSTGKQTMSFESKSLFAPQFGHIQNGKVQEIADPGRNPAQGQVVYLMISAFSPKNFNNLGSTFDAVVYEEGPIDFYEGNNSLSGFGAAMNMPVESMPAGQTPAPQTASQPEPNNGFGQPNQDPNQGQNGFGNAPVGDPNQNQGGFGQGQPNQNQGGQPNSPFGVQDKDVNGGGSPFGGGAGNNGQRGNSPFA